MRFVEPTELGVERRGDRRASRALGIARASSRTCSNDLELVAKCTVLIPAGKPESPNALRARKYSSVCGDPASHSAMNASADSSARSQRPSMKSSQMRLPRTKRTLEASP